MKNFGGFTQHLSQLPPRRIYKPTRRTQQTTLHNKKCRQHCTLFIMPKMNSSARKPSKKLMALVVLQLLDITVVESRDSSGVFAVVRRRNESLNDSSAPSFFRNRRTRSMSDVLELEENIVYQSDERSVQDSTPECTGRFAMEYEIERNMMRSAENPYIQRSVYEENSEETINSNAHRNINPASVFRSEPTESKSRQRRQVFSYDNDDSIFV